MGLVESEETLVDWIRNRRRTLGLTQEEVVQAVRRSGIAMSRGHLSNLETGAYPLRAEHVIAFDRVLEADGWLMALAERVWGRPVRGLLPVDWANIGRSMYDLLANDAKNPVSIEQDDIELWWNERPPGDSIVVKGREQVEAAMFALIRLAAKQPLPQTLPPIALAGVFEGLRSGNRPGLPKLVRESLRAVMERGRQCRHYIPSERDDLDETTLVYIVAPLLACPRFDARILDRKVSPVVENMMVIPHLASVQFYATESARHIDAAVIHTGAEPRRVLEDRMAQLDAMSSRFVARYPRQEVASEEDFELTEPELAFRRRLAEIATIRGPACAVLAHFPTATNPPAVYAERIDRRRKMSKNEFDPAWREIVDLQAERHFALRDQLERGFSYRVVVPEEQFDTPPEDSDEWTRDERSALFDGLLALLEEYPTFEIGVASPRLAPGVAGCRWEVRQSQARSIVLVQSFATVGRRPPNGDPDLQAVDILIEKPGPVRAFSNYFDDLWGRVAEHDRSDIIKRLKRL